MIQNLSIRKLQDLCGVISSIFKGCEVVVAGGALRDLLHDRQVKDIDVFIQGEFDPFEDEADEMEWHCKKLGTKLHCDPVFEWEHHNGGESGSTHSCFSLVDYPMGLHWHPVQLIFIEDSPRENVKRHFDFGLSRVWCSATQLRMEPEYWKDHYRQCISYTPSDEPTPERMLSSARRLQRLKLKYPNWRFEAFELSSIEVPPEVTPLTVSITDGNGKRMLNRWMPYAGEKLGD